MLRSEPTETTPVETVPTVNVEASVFEDGKLEVEPGTEYHVALPADASPEIAIDQAKTSEQLDAKIEDGVLVLHAENLEAPGTLTLCDPVNDTTWTLIVEVPTEAPQQSLGDVNGDGKINATDAAQILIEAANIGASKPSGLKPGQEAAADVNGDGKINATDAAIVLQYAAYIGAGNPEITITAFIQNRKNE